MRQMHVPLRRCVVCRGQFSKRELTRVVRTPEGSVEVDPSGKKNGRGAYLCTGQACWRQALAKKHLDTALRAPVSPGDRTQLDKYAQALVESQSPSA